MSPIKGHKMKDEHKKKIGEAQKRIKNKPPSRKGSVQSVESRKKMSLAKTGKKQPNISRACIGREGKKGAESHLWKGGITSEHKIVRSSKEYRLWRAAVFERDNYTCIWCGVRGGNLNADHIKPFASYPELRFAIDNGRTLCINCHKTTKTYAGNKQEIRCKMD